MEAYVLEDVLNDFLASVFRLIMNFSIFNFRFNKAQKAFLSGTGIAEFASPAIPTFISNKLCKISTDGGANADRKKRKRCKVQSNFQLHSNA